jgi:site-specific DNA recombinase
MKCATYARYSTEAQRASSIVDQRRNCAKRAQTEGWAIVAEFADEAISGSVNRRPQYTKMQEAAAAKKFDVLLLDDLSRLSRDSVEQETVIRRLEFQGIRIISVSDGYDSTSKARKVHRGFKGMMNEMFLDDLAEKIHRGQTGVALAGQWPGGRAYGYKLFALRDPAKIDAYGDATKVGTLLTVDPVTGPIVKEIFESFAAGASCLTIAKTLNQRHVPSPATTWKREVRRADGWMASGVRAILLNPLYKGQLKWNRTTWTRDPDTKKRVRRKRPKAEWVEKTLPEIRIVEDATWAMVALRMSSLKDGDKRLKNGGVAKYLLSGLLRCDKCGANYVQGNGRSYACSSYTNGRACSNSIAVRRDALESVILGPIQEGLQDARRVARMVAFMEEEHARRTNAATAKAESAPAELRALDDRAAAIRSIPGLEDDERAALLDRVEAKRRELLAARPAEPAQAGVFGLLPKAAAAFCKVVKSGLAGHPEATAKARVVLRGLVGRIDLQPRLDGSLWASYRLNPAALVKPVWSSGSGGRI